MSKLFLPITLKNVTIKNRIVMAPMCMFSGTEEGYATDFHFVHYGTRAVGGAGLIIQEATAVEARGRISARDLGIWSDEHIEGLSRIVALCRENGASVGIQLAHAGRKCVVEGEEIISPSPFAFDENSRIPVEMTKADITEVVSAFRAAAARADAAGYDFIELHGAHGYLINQFLSRLTNHRTDEYGGTPENRIRFLLEILKAVREVWPEEKPIGVRFSAEEYGEKGNHPDDIAKMINLIKDEGIDIVDVSSGGVIPAMPQVYPGYQLEYANEINYKTGLPVIGGGLVVNSAMAEEILQNNRADMVYFGRELLRNPYFPIYAARELGEHPGWPVQYERAVK